MASRVLGQFNQVSNLAANLFLRELSQQAIGTHNMVIMKERDTIGEVTDSLDTTLLDHLHINTGEEYFYSRCVHRGSFILQPEVQNNVVYNLLDSHHSLYFLLDNICRQQCQSMLYS